MPTSNQEPSQVAEALDRLSVAMEQLQVRYDASQRASRRIQVALVVVLIFLGWLAYHTLSPVADIVTQIPEIIPRLKPPSSQVVEAAAEERQRLMASLPPDRRAQIELFEQQQKWVSDYLAANPDFNTGAAVALFLSQMSQSVQVMPELYAEVRSMTEEVRSMNNEMHTMNDKMSALPVLAADIQMMRTQMEALPVLATEVRGMHFYMSLMAKDMDSTMGEAGRMMPWNW